EVFRGSENLFSQPGDPAPYDLSAVFKEFLNLSPVEHALFTDPDPLDNWHLLYGFDDSSKSAAQNQQDALASLSSAKTLAQRLGVSYKELVDLVRTVFVNPQLAALALLGKLGVEVEDVFLFKTNEAQFATLLAADPSSLTDEELTLLGELKAFQQRLDALATTFPEFDAEAWLEQAWQDKLFDSVLVLAAPGAGCDFGATRLCYADGADVDALPLIKLNLFTRLWRRLGWTLEETDGALSAFLPADSQPLTAAGLGEALRTALVYLAHFKWLDGRVRVGKNGRAKLLTLWSNLPTTGSRPLYAQLFLTRSVLKQDAVFDDPLGNYLSQSGVPLQDHLPALQAALSLTAGDIAAILSDAGEALDTAPLSLATVSLLYRYGTLARALKMSVPELITLKGLSGLDPFKPLAAAPLTALAEDYPFTETMRFIQAASALKESGLHVEDLDYFFRQRFDPVGKYRTDSDALLGMLRGLAADLSRVRQEQSTPASVTDELLRQKLALVLTPETLAAFLEGIGGTSATEATRENISPANALDPATLAGEPGMRLEYDEVAKLQRLTSRGLLLDARKARLKGPNPPSLLKGLLDDVQAFAFTSLGGRIESDVDELVGASEYHAVLENVQPADQLAPEAFAGEPSVRVAYDETRSLQRLTWRGLLLDEKKAALNSSVSSPILSDLLDAVQAQGMEEAEALVKASLAVATGALEFTAVETNVLPSAKLNPDSFGPGIRVAYEDVPEWNDAAVYQADDVLSFGGSAWVAKRVNTNVEPADGDDWGGPHGRAQSLTFRGLLSDAKKTELKTANSSTVLSSLLDAVQAQTGALVGQLRVGLFVKNDFKPLFTQLPEVGDAGADTRARLAEALLPFVIRKLTRQAIVQSVAAALGADPDLTEALLTDASLLADPTSPDGTLLDAFAAADESGVSASFFTSSDGSGVTLEAGPISSPDTAQGPSGANSARFEGYLEVATTGAYRLFATASKQGAEVELRFAQLPDPLLQLNAAADAAESSAFIELKAGVTYAFTFTANNLGGGDASLLVQGEGLPKGSAARLVLRPAEAVERFRRAHVLLSNSLALVAGLGLTTREVRYFLTHPADFDGISLNRLPTREADDSPALASSLFNYFLRLVEYARLKREVAGETDDLIGLFENARHTLAASADAVAAKAALLEDLSVRLAALTRREAVVIRETAEALGLDATATPAVDKLHVEAEGFARETGLRRLWDALQVVETLGLTVGAVVRATGIISPAKTQDERFAIAGDLRNTVKARYEPENWQRIAQPIFDKLRQGQRDALVAHIMHRRGFERVEELFEYFLIDPGMEPVVQTSRLRLAISSVQLFIQRVLLNLEPQVDPSALNASHWEWMKRYRIWEANRKIFLFPENWLEPEFRDDKTHLFQELESALLEGDFSNDLAEDAFFNYLKKLEELSRLDVVAMYCEEEPLDPASNKVHVIARTFSLPHKYFYRRYQYRMWTPWEPVPVEIDGDHVVAVIWRQRLNLFWVTFLEKAKQNTNGAPLPLDMQGTVNVPTVPDRQVDVQLSWSEYFQGQWTPRESSGYVRPITVDVEKGFDKRDVFIFAVKEYDADGEESAVRVQLSGEVNMLEYQGKGEFTGGNQMRTAFRVVSKLSAPEVVERQPTQPYEMPYTKDHAEANRYVGKDSLEVSFVEKVEESGGSSSASPKVQKQILEKADKFSVLLPSNLPQLVVPEFAPLINPFFFQDRHHTFYVEPTLTEQTFLEWQDWIVPVAGPDLDFDVPITASDPEWLDPGGPVEFDPLSIYEFGDNFDWATSPGTLLQFGDAWVSGGGGVNVQQLPAMSTSAFEMF
ncbi:MAG: neuraminidase-like domain-containing protein, partial [Pyrinomonadaceae bacterium]